MKNYIILIIFSLSFTNNFAQISTDRPDQTEGTHVLRNGDFQIESGWTFNSDGGSLNNLLRIGTFKGIELRFSTNLISVHEDMTGLFPSLDNLEFGAKFKILDKKETLTKISFLSHLSVSTEYSDNSGGLLNRVLVSHELSESFELAYNLGYTKSFLQNQVRSMVGSLKYLSLNKWDLKKFDKIFKSKKRQLCAPPAPACGLYLKYVIY